MPKFRVYVTETVFMSYEDAVIEAESVEAAETIAEYWRVEGWLGESRFRAVDDVEVAVAAVSDDVPLSVKKED